MKVYKITNKVNGKIYIGVTKCSLSKRWNEHKSKAKSGKSHLSKAIAKYGQNNFCIELIKECSNEDEMYKLEVSLIKELSSNNPVFGYNNSSGGEKSSLGRTASDETKRKLSEYQRSRIRKPHSVGSRINMSLSAKGRDMSELIKKSVAKRRGKPSHNAIIVEKYARSGELVETFNSMSEAAKSVFGVACALSAIKRGRLKTYKNFIWKFKN